MSTLTKDSKVVLKLDLGAKGVRRISLAKLWDETNFTLSYNRLVELAIEYSDVPTMARENNKVVVSTTYTDEDGDDITISSNEELHDAFQQFVGKEPPVLRAKASVQTKREIKKAALKQAAMAAHKKSNDSDATVPASTAPVNFNKWTTPTLRNLNETMNVPTKTSPHPLRTVKTISKVLPNNSAPTPSSPPVQTQTAPSTTNPNADNYESNFIHGRHTCDGCLMNPIIGGRYHAVNHPDYDLCQKCFDNYTGSGELIFKSAQLDRDRHLQPRWKRQHMRRCRPKMMKHTAVVHNKPATAPKKNMTVAGTQSKKVIDRLDPDLKEAIRRSLLDAWPPTKKEENQKTTVKEPTTATKNDASPTPPVTATPVVESDDAIHVEFRSLKEETDIPVDATVIDITAGDDETKHLLASMDPNTKETIRRNLTRFFARRHTNKVLDRMDPETKENIRGTLNDFFTRRAEEKGVKRTQYVLDRMDADLKETVKRSLNEMFAARRACAQNNVKGGTDIEEEATATDTDTKEGSIKNIVVDVIVDNECDLSEDGSEDDLRSSTNLSEGSDDDDDDDDDSNCLHEQKSQEDWQMVTEDDEMIAVAAQMLGSALFQSDASTLTISSETNETA